MNWRFSLFGKKFRGVFPKIFLSLIVILTVIIILYNSIFSFYLNKEYEKKIYEKNYSSLTFISNYIDAIVETIVVKRNFIANDKNVLNKALVPTKQDVSRDGSIISLLNNITNESTYIDSIYIYYPYDDTVFASAIGVEKRSYFKNQDILKHSDIIDSQFFLSENKQKLISYYYDFPIAGEYKMGTIIINVNIDTILSELSEKSKIPIKLSLLTKEGVFLLIDDTMKDLVKQNSEILNSIEDGFMNFEINDSSKVLYCNTSYKYGLRCFDILDKPSLFDLQILPKQIIIYLLILFFLLSVIISLVFSNFIYKPLKNIVSIFSLGSKDFENEYRLIENSYNDIINEKMKLEDNLDKVKPLIEKSFFRRYTRNSYLDINELNYYQKYIDVDSYREKIIKVVILNVSNNFVEKDENPDLRLTIESIKKWITGLNTCFEKQIYNFVSPFEIIVTCIFDKTTLIDDIEKLTYTFMKEIINFPSDDINKIFLTMSSGRALVGFQNIHKSYNQAKKILQYKLYLGDLSLQSHEPINSVIENKISHNISEEIEEYMTSIINLLKISDWENAKNNVNSIVDYFITNKIMNRYLISHYFLSLADEIIEYIISQDINPSNIFGPTQTLYSEITNTNNISKIKNLLLNCIDNIRYYFENNSMNKNDKYKIKIKNYIEENYFDSNLSLNTIADYLEINPSYFSKLFKKEFNQNFITYLSHYRIEKAKQMLENTQLSVKEVGFKVGFTTIQSFIRTFKKLEGVTPGKFF